MSTWNIFGSYYSNTYLPHVDLEKSLRSHCCPDQDLVSRVTDLITPEVQKDLAEPLPYSLAEINKKNRIILADGFDPISEKHIGKKFISQMY